MSHQLMAEIGNVSRFTHKGAITAFAGVDPGVNGKNPEPMSKKVFLLQNADPLI